MLKLRTTETGQAGARQRDVFAHVSHEAATLPGHTAKVGGVPISLVGMADVVATMAGWVATRQTRQISTADVHAIMRAGIDGNLMRAFSNADLVLADGAPVALAAGLNAGHSQPRVCGPDLMLEACQQGLVLGWRHYIYGGKEGVALALAAKLQLAFPGLQIAGIECPPFRSLSDAEVIETAQRISASGADIVWVGLGCPKQDIWMHRICPFLSGSVMVGVGAAFDFHSGYVKRAPKWMRRAGLEWLHRLASDPRRLWHRYLVLAPRFIARVLAPSIGEALRRRLALSTTR